MCRPNCTPAALANGTDGGLHPATWAHTRKEPCGEGCWTVWCPRAPTTRSLGAVQRHGGDGPTSLSSCFSRRWFLQFLLSFQLLMTARSAETEHYEDIGDYDYGNANDTCNFCPGLQVRSRPVLPSKHLSFLSPPALGGGRLQELLVRGV